MKSDGIREKVKMVWVDVVTVVRYGKMVIERSAHSDGEREREREREREKEPSLPFNVLEI
jgi:hypothetical protein